MRIWMVVLVVGCGGSTAITSRGDFIKWHKGFLAENDRKCDLGDLESCAMAGRDHLQPWKDDRHPDWADDTVIDPAKGKAELMKACVTPAALSNHRDGDCALLADKVNLSAAEANELCEHNDKLCAVIGDKTKLDDRALADLCAAHAHACAGIASRVADPAIKTEVTVTAFLAKVDLLVNNESEVSVGKAEGDKEFLDDVTSAADEAAADGCHKDSECKGDRICEDGKCVDAKAHAAAKPAAAKPPAKLEPLVPELLEFGPTPCDTVASIVQFKMTDCTAFKGKDAELHADLAAATKAFASLGDDRKQAVTEVCTRTTGRVMGTVDKHGCIDAVGLTANCIKIVEKRRKLEACKAVPVGDADKLLEVYSNVPSETRIAMDKTCVDQEQAFANIRCK